jgi:superfamily II DNA helicase RecQ
MTICINNNQLLEASKANCNLWEEAKAPAASVLVLSPEQLVGVQFNVLLQPGNNFYNRVAMLTLDKAHLLDKWGPDFQKSFIQIGYICDCLNSGAVVALTTTTMLAGPPTIHILCYIGLNPNQVHTIQHSNRHAQFPSTTVFSSGWVLCKCMHPLLRY